METFVLKTGLESNPSYIKIDKMAIYQVIPPLSEVLPEANQEPVNEPVSDEGDKVVEENTEQPTVTEPEEKQE